MKRLNFNFLKSFCLLLGFCVVGLSAYAETLMMKVGMHFTQPTTWCSMRLWRSQDTLLPASIILKHFKSLMNGLAAMMPALIILLTRQLNSKRYAA